MCSLEQVAISGPSEPVKVVYDAVDVVNNTSSSRYSKVKTTDMLCRLNLLMTGQLFRPAATVELVLVITVQTHPDPNI